MEIYFIVSKIKYTHHYIHELPGCVFVYILGATNTQNEAQNEAETPSSLLGQFDTSR